MSDNKLETVEPDPAATSLSNDEPVNKSEDSNVQAKDAADKSDATGVAPTDAPTSDNIAKDTKVETDGHASKDTNGEAADTETKPSSENSHQQRKEVGIHGEENPGKYKTSGLKERGNRFDPSLQEKTEDPVQIRKQVEFYFSDHNLARDKFLYEQVGGPANNPIKIEVIHSFKRMRRFQPFEAVVKALKESEVLDVIDDSKIQRKTPLPAEFADKSREEITKMVEDQSLARSVYVKGFGKEEPSTQFDLEAWFGKFGDTNAVRLRRADDKSFKGSVFTEFANEETAQKFVDQDPKPTYNDRELLIMSKKKYCDDKLQAMSEGKIRPNTHKSARGRDKDRDDNRDWRERRNEDAKRGFRNDRDDKRGGGRGRGRGGRGGGRGRGRGGRDDRNRERRDRDADNDKAENASAEKSNGATGNGSTTKDKDAPKEAAQSPPKKRAREDDGEGRESKKEKLDT